MIPTIRDAVREDIAFLDTANAAMAWETEHKRLDFAVVERGVAGIFDDPRRGFYLIAEHAGAAAGSLLITHEWSDWRSGKWWWIQSVYVMPPARRHGMFRALYAEVERRARARPGVVGLRLYVERDNVRAQQTYAALGMAPTQYNMFEREFPLSSQ